MTTRETTPRKPLRLWPGVVAAVLLVLVRLGTPVVFPEAVVFAVFGAMACALAIVAWWVFLSRAPWSERLGAVVLMIAALVAMRLIVHESIRGGHLGTMLPLYGFPLLSVALVASAAAGRRLAARWRRATIVGGIVLACGLMAAVRTGGISGLGHSEFHWRWTMTPEERLLSEDADQPIGSVRTLPAVSGR